MALEADITRCLGRHPVVRLGILFGSANEGRAGYESDLDLAVMGERALSAEEKMALIEALARRTGRPVDLVDLQTTHGLLLRRILQTGTRLYSTDDALYAELIKRQVFDQADFAPYRNRILAERRKAWIDS